MNSAKYSKFPISTVQYLRIIQDQINDYSPLIRMPYIINRLLFEYIYCPLTWKRRRKHLRQD